MRLWTLHPENLDRAGLVALWREALLAQAVLAGKTKGYRNHPQLERFKKAEEPLSAIGAYLSTVRKEAVSRGYSFNPEKILKPSFSGSAGRKIPVSKGQVRYECNYLKRKVSERSPSDLSRISGKINPIFRQVQGRDPESWEKISNISRGKSKSPRKSP